MYVISTNYKAEKKRLLVWSPGIHSVSFSLELKKKRTFVFCNFECSKETPMLIPDMLTKKGSEE